MEVDRCEAHYHLLPHVSPAAGALLTRRVSPKHITRSAIQNQLRLLQIYGWTESHVRILYGMWDRRTADR